jgi:hypothetical protein
LLIGNKKLLIASRVASTSVTKAQNRGGLQQYHNECPGQAARAPGASSNVIISVGAKRACTLEGRVGFRQKLTSLYKQSGRVSVLLMASDQYIRIYPYVLYTPDHHSCLQSGIQTNVISHAEFIERMIWRVDAYAFNDAFNDVQSNIFLCCGPRNHCGPQQSKDVA